MRGCFFPDFAPARRPTRRSKPELRELAAPLRDYVCAVMIDFCAVDPELDEVPVAAAIDWARELECLGALEKMLTRELRMKAKDVKRLKESAAAVLRKSGGAGMSEAPSVNAFTDVPSFRHGARWL